jgi:hypothetical protein
MRCGIEITRTLRKDVGHERRGLVVVDGVEQVSQRRATEARPALPQPTKQYSVKGHEGSSSM